MYELLMFIGLFGTAAGCFAIAVVIAAGRYNARRKEAAGSAYIPTDDTALELNPGAFMSRWGQNGRAHISLDTVTMRPTIGFKMFCVLLLGLIALMMTGGSGSYLRQDLITVTLVVTMTVFIVHFLTFYEVSYNGEGITAPGPLFRPLTYQWEDFIEIRKTDSVTYTLIFGAGKVRVRKFLVGMPTFLTFVTDVREMNKRR